ncbi:MAG: 2-oxo acid dehydrogenase subunit E2, partial [Actinobacteria bacterium]|nr:2-oxo acid dehydrogenase subunit E2 [Actinomycetota bacterium]
MATPVTMPQLGESVTQGTIARWLKAEGDGIEKDEPLCEVDTDKVSAELPSPFAGKVEKLLISEGTTVDVGTEIALVRDNGNLEDEPFSEDAPAREDAYAEAPTEEFPAADTKTQPVARNGEKQSAVAEARIEARSDGDGQREVESAGALRLTRSSPVVRRLAEEHAVDIAEISGTGTGGRVTKKDIEGYIEEREEEYEAPGLKEERETSAPPGAASGRPERAAEEPALQRAEVYEGDQIVELTSIRRAIANRMSQSKREAPHAWTMVEADVTGLVGLRRRVKEEFESREGVRPTYLPFIVKAVVESLKEHPVLNSVWDGDRILLRNRINIGVAVDLDDAL